MIRGYFATQGTRRRPFIDAILQFPTLNSRNLDVKLTVCLLDTFSLPTLLTILDPPPGPMPSIPSLLGRDILSHFALFLEERTNRVLLLEAHEADALPL